MTLLTQFTNNIDKWLDKISPSFFYIITTVHLIYVLVFLGIIGLNPALIETINISIQIMVCLILMYRFRPFNEHKLHPYDTYLIFGSSSFLILTLIFTQTFKALFPNLSNKITTITDTIANSKKMIIDSSNNAALITIPITM